MFIQSLYSLVKIKWSYTNMSVKSNQITILQQYDVYKSSIKSNYNTYLSNISQIFV